MKRVLFITALIYLLVAAFLYLQQELFIFPPVRERLLKDPPTQESARTLPAGITEFYATTSDGEKINVWTNYQPGENYKNIAMIFHGNAETVERKNFMPFFRSMGIPAFSFDYRGYGRSSGWPSENGIYQDAEAVWNEISKRTKVESSKLIILGNSLGSGPASYMARKLHPQALILLAAYADFSTLVASMPLYAPFRWVLRYKFPVTEYLMNTQLNCVILAHGKQDEKIPFAHMQLIRQALAPGIQQHILESEDADHNNIFYQVEDRLKTATLSCLGIQP